MIGDVVPNAFTGWALVDGLLTRLRVRAWSDDDIGRLAAFLIDELRKALLAERERQAPELFRAGLDASRIQFALRGDGLDWRMPERIWTTLPETASQMLSATGGPLERSLFLPIYQADLNDDERTFAVYLDKDAALRWWHRNGAMKGSYGLRGWRRGNVYPDFLFAALKDDAGRERIVVIETKGEQLEGNRDTEYKRALLDTLSRAFKPGEAATGATHPGRDVFDFAAAVVLFDEKDARMPGLISGNVAGNAACADK